MVQDLQRAVFNIYLETLLVLDAHFLHYLSGQVNHDDCISLLVLLTALNVLV